MNVSIPMFLIGSLPVEGDVGGGVAGGGVTIGLLGFLRLLGLPISVVGGEYTG